MARPPIPTFQAPKRKKRKLRDRVKFGTLAPTKKRKRPMPPSALMQDEEHKPSPKEELHRGMAKGLASAALAMPGRGKAGRILKGAVAGAAAGAEIEAAYHKYKARRKKARARKATTTVTQSAMAQKAQYHKKDKTSTEKL